MPRRTFLKAAGASLLFAENAMAIPEEPERRALRHAEGKEGAMHERLAIIDTFLEAGKTWIRELESRKKKLHREVPLHLHGKVARTKELEKLSRGNDARKWRSILMGAIEEKGAETNERTKLVEEFQKIRQHKYDTLKALDTVEEQLKKVHMEVDEAQRERMQIEIMLSDLKLLRGLLERDH